ncbi:MAG: LysR family transcriptional regulator [Lachnospiraceae bacterium]|nr:LysR family transcriptional regulator [Lachnospiraceae bacterium]
MNLRHIRIFLMVTNCNNSISAAARKLMISQPSITVAVRELEAEFDVPLFDRLSHRLYLTEAGRRFEQYAKKIAAACDDLEREMSSWNTAGVLHVGASITAGSQFMPEYAAEYRKKQPDINLRVRVDHSRNLERMLLDNALDLAVIETPVHDDMLEAVLFREDSLEAILPPSDKGSSSVLTFDRFCSLPFLLREPGSGTREVFEQTMREKGRSIVPIWTANSTTALVNAVSRGMGISVIPHEAAAEAEAAGKVCTASVKGLTFTQRFYIVRHKDKLLMPYMEDFIDVVRETAV